MGWTTDLLVGLGEHLDAAGVATWRPTGAYTDGETGIVVRAIPQQPDRLITLAPYPRDDADHRGMADHDLALQVRVRGDTDPRTCDDIADAVFAELDSLSGVVLSGVPLVQMWRQSYTSLGQDDNNRWQRSENYYLQAMRPTARKTD